MRQYLTQTEFVRQWQQSGSAQKMAEATGMDVSSIHKRRKRLIGLGHDLKTVSEPGYESRTPDRYHAGWTFPRQKELWVSEGGIVVFSDCHYWPGEAPIAHKAMIDVVKAIKPRAVIANGDIFDGAGLSRHDPFGWNDLPSPIEELEVCQERLHEVELAAPKGCELLWNIGNHDVRWERTLSRQADRFKGMKGLRLADHFSAWDMRWSTLVNWQTPHPVMVKHRHAGGIHAGYNNTLKAGISTVTGHTHQLEAKPWGDYRGRRWGIQTGSVADHHSPSFEYAENSPSPMCSGFAVLTFHDGVLAPPELAEVIGGKCWFRGRIIA